MRPRDFCYWLMGAFEVCDPKSLNEAQVESVKTHLSLVDKHEQAVKQPSPHMGTCQAIKTILIGKKTIRGAELAVVKKLLSAEFVHIDADTEGDQAAMNSIHGPGRPPGVMRC